MSSKNEQFMWYSTAAKLAHKNVQKGWVMTVGKNKQSTVNKIAALSCSIVLTLSLGTAFAEGEGSGFTISPMVGKAFFAKNRSLENEQFTSIAFGYEFDDKWAAELAYLTLEPEVEDSVLEVDIDHYRLDGLYHLAQGKLRPYVVAGLGESELELNSAIKEHDTFANLGVGVKYALSSFFFLRSDVRLVQGLDSGESDYLAGVGALFKFGHSVSTKPYTKKAKKIEKPSDSDKDGISDDKDQCPNSALGAVVDPQGCAVDNDLDKDGVVNAEDHCPDSKEGAKVDEKGCYLLLKEDISVALEINFATNSDEVISDAFSEVKKVAEFMRSYPSANVVFEGHTDDRGAADYNRNLSQRRADAVAKILIETFNISTDRVSSVGYGEEKPLFDNSTADNRAKNRRVVAVVNATVEKVTE